MAWTSVRSAPCATASAAAPSGLKTGRSRSLAPEDVSGDAAAGSPDPEIGCPDAAIVAAKGKAMSTAAQPAISGSIGHRLRTDGCIQCHVLTHGGVLSRA